MVAVLPGRQVALLVVAGVVADHAARDAPDAFRHDRIGQRLEAGGDVSLGRALRLQERGVIGGGEHRVTPAHQPDPIDGPVHRVGRRDDAGLERGVGAEDRQRGRRDEQLLGRRGDERRVAVVGGDGVAAGVDDEARSVPRRRPVERGLEVLRTDGFDDRLGYPPHRPQRRRGRRSGGGRCAGVGIAARERHEPHDRGCDEQHADDDPPRGGAQTAVSRSPQNSSRSTRLSSLPESVRGSSSRTS